MASVTAFTSLRIRARQTDGGREEGGGVAADAATYGIVNCA